MKISAIALNAEFCNVAENLRRAENLISEAKAVGAELVLLPEFFNSAMGFDKRMLSVADMGSVTHDWMVGIASKYNVILGGSYLSLRGNDAYNLFELVFPNGETFSHSKDLPTQYENCYYRGGDTNYILKTPIGNIGVALCWEMIRYDTVRRMSGMVDLVLAGSCWWDLDKNAPQEKNELRKYNQKLALDAPVSLAKILGVPVVHSAHCGTVTAYRFPNEETLQTRQYVGAAEIIDTDGTIITSRSFDEGAGVATANIMWKSGKRRSVFEFPNSYWIPDLPKPYIDAWNKYNSIGKQYYEKVARPLYRRK